MLTKLEGVGKAGGGGESWRGWGKRHFCVPCDVTRKGHVGIDFFPMYHILNIKSCLLKRVDINLKSLL